MLPTLYLGVLDWLFAKETRMPVPDYYWEHYQESRTGKCIIQPINTGCCTVASTQNTRSESTSSSWVRSHYWCIGRGYKDRWRKITGWVGGIFGANHHLCCRCCTTITTYPTALASTLIGSTIMLEYCGAFLCHLATRGGCCSFSVVKMTRRCSFILKRCISSCLYAA